MKTTLETVLEFRKTLQRQRRRDLERAHEVLLGMVEQLIGEPCDSERAEKIDALLLAVECIDKAIETKAENPKAIIL